MASISRDRDPQGKYNGCRTLQYTNADGARKGVRLGNVSAKTAELIRAKVEAILTAKYANISWDKETAEWVGGIGDKLHDKLARVGILPPREKAEIVSIGEFIDGFIGGRKHALAKSTNDNHRQTRDDLITYFGAETPLDQVTPGDADDWRIWLEMDPESQFSGRPGRGLNENSARKRCGIARQFFNAARKKRLIVDNPFAEVQGGVTVRPNRAREHYVPRETMDRIIAACNNVEFRLVLALARYGGLRCPSELSLTWDDIDWDLARITVRSPKTEHHAGKELRVIPLFPELRPHLEAVRAARADSKSPYLLRENYRRPDANLRTPLLKLLKRLKLKPWPKPIQNLRASRAIDLAQEFAPHIAAAWAGHSEQIAAQHYWRATDADFERASGMRPCVQQPAEIGGNDQQAEHEKVAISREKPVVYKRTMLPVGIEPTTY